MWPSIVTCRSSIDSSSADCVFGDARLISSASTTLANTGPGRNSKSLLFRFQIDAPVTSLGSRSGVNWIRCHEPPVARARRLRERRLADAGDVLDEEMALGEQADERQVHGPPLAEQHAFDLRDERVEHVAEVLFDAGCRLSHVPPLRDPRRATMPETGRRPTHATVPVNAANLAPP